MSLKSKEGKEQNKQENKDLGSQAENHSCYNLFYTCSHLDCSALGR